MRTNEDFSKSVKVAEFIQVPYMVCQLNKIILNIYFACQSIKWQFSQIGASLCWDFKNACNCNVNIILFFNPDSE